MRILSWNIQAGGGPRLSRIVEEVSAYGADLVALTEFRGGEAFQQLGLPHSATSDGIAVFSARPLAVTRREARWLEVDLPAERFGIGVLRIPASGSSAKSPATLAKVALWNALVRAAEALLDQPFLLLGPWNTGAHYLDESGKTFVCTEQFARLSELGWVDLWRHHNPGITEWTWYSKVKGGANRNGFRLDHAFASPALAPRVTSCRYSHTERNAGVSSHSLVIVEVE